MATKRGTNRLGERERTSFLQRKSKVTRTQPERTDLQETVVSKGGRPFLLEVAEKRRGKSTEIIVRTPESAKSQETGKNARQEGKTDVIKGVSRRPTKKRDNIRAIRTRP